MNIYERIKRLLKWKKYSETTIRSVIEELIEEDGADTNGVSSIDNDEREMLGNVLNLKDIQVQDIMVPRVGIKALPITAKIDELLFEFVENQISTVLVYQGTIDNIIGVVYIKDVINWFRMNKPFNLSMFVKDVIFVPPTMRTLDLLLQMRETGIKISVVVDEYGGVDGCISFSDLVEEIIGDIQDADEQRNKKKIIRNVDGSFTTDARTTLSEITKNTGIKFALQDKSVDSIGGYIVSIVGKVPVRGELVLCEKSGVDFEILDADPRKIKSIKIRKIA